MFPGFADNTVPAWGNGSTSVYWDPGSVIDVIVVNPATIAFLKNLGATVSTLSNGHDENADLEDLAGTIKNLSSGKCAHPHVPVGTGRIRKPPAPCDSKILQNQYLQIYAQIGKDLNVNLMFIIAFSLQEGGWTLTDVYQTNPSSKGQQLNDLFGTTYAGGHNIAYRNVQASANAWENNWAPYLTTSPPPATIGAFTADLESNPTHMYNSVNPNGWMKSVAADFNTLNTEFADCNIRFPQTTQEWLLRRNKP
jgi:hypothetical protein